MSLGNQFAYLGCADSRVAETSILAQKPGEIFVVRFHLASPSSLACSSQASIARRATSVRGDVRSDKLRLAADLRILPGNEYLVDDLSSETVISYAIAHLGVQHIIIMGKSSLSQLRSLGPTFDSHRAHQVRRRASCDHQPEQGSHHQHGRDSH